MKVCQPLLYTSLSAPCSKFLSKNISLERLLTEFRQEAADTAGCDESSEDLDCDDDVRCNDNAAGTADSPMSCAASEGIADVKGMQVDDTLGYCQVRQDGGQQCLHQQQRITAKSSNAVH